MYVASKIWKAPFLARRYSNAHHQLSKTSDSSFLYLFLFFYLHLFLSHVSGVVNVIPGDYGIPIHISIHTWMCFTSFSSFILMAINKNVLRWRIIKWRKLKRYIAAERTSRSPSVVNVHAFISVQIAWVFPFICSQIFPPNSWRVCMCNVHTNTNNSCI